MACSILSHSNIFQNLFKPFFLDSCSSLGYGSWWWGLEVLLTRSERRMVGSGEPQDESNTITSPPNKKITNSLIFCRINLHLLSSQYVIWKALNPNSNSFILLPSQYLNWTIKLKKGGYLNLDWCLLHTRQILRILHTVSHILPLVSEGDKWGKNSPSPGNLYPTFIGSKFSKWENTILVRVGSSYAWGTQKGQTCGLFQLLDLGLHDPTRYWTHMFHI